MKRVDFHLTEKQIKSLKAMAKSTGLSMAEIIRRAVDQYLPKSDARSVANKSH